MVSVDGSNLAAIAAVEIFPPMSPARAVQSPAKVGQSPAKLCQSPARLCQSPASLRVATPLRGRKRTASIASIAEGDGPPKIQQTDTLRVGPEGSPSAKTGEQLPASEPQRCEQQTFPLHVAYLRRRLSGLRRKCLPTDPRRVRPRLGSLDAYKKAIDSTTEWVTVTGTTHEADEGTYVMHPGLQHPGTGAEKMCVENIIDEISASTPLQITLGYQDAETGTMMCYSLCDENDPDLQAMRVMCDPGNNGAYNCEDEDERSAYESDSDSLSRSSAESYSSSESEASSHCPEQVSVLDEQFPDEEWHGDIVWEDQASGTVLSYAACDGKFDAEFSQLDALSQEARQKDFADLNIMSRYNEQCSCDEAKFPGEQQQYTEIWEDAEWKDPISGTILSYSVCDDETAEDALELGVILQEEVDSRIGYRGQTSRITMEWRDESTGSMMGYAVCDDSDEEATHIQETACPWLEESPGDHIESAL